MFQKFIYGAASALGFQASKILPRSTAFLGGYKKGKPAITGGLSQEYA
jgi:hypothetical protein